MKENILKDKSYQFAVEIAFDLNHLISVSEQTYL
ncbi:hypothetical protein ES703_51503 [subsurface metagenome]